MNYPCYIRFFCCKLFSLICLLKLYYSIPCLVGRNKSFKKKNRRKENDEESFSYLVVHRKFEKKNYY